LRRKILVMGLLGLCFAVLSGGRGTIVIYIYMWLYLCSNLWLFYDVVLKLNVCHDGFQG